MIHLEDMSRLLFYQPINHVSSITLDEIDDNLLYSEYLRVKNSNGDTFSNVGLRKNVWIPIFEFEIERRGL